MTATMAIEIAGFVFLSLYVLWMDRWFKRMFAKLDRRMEQVGAMLDEIDRQNREAVN